MTPIQDAARDIRLSDLAAGISALVFVVALLVLLGSWGG